MKYKLINECEFHADSGTYWLVLASCEVQNNVPNYTKQIKAIQNKM